MRSGTAIGVGLAMAIAGASVARADVPAGKQPGHFAPLPAAQVQCQVSDAMCHRVAAYVLEHISPWIADHRLLDAVAAQNVDNAKLTNIDIDKLDIGWIDRSDKQLIDSKMKNGLSAYLKSKKDLDPDVIVEIFAFDQLGLNVGQTDPTQDYNQGDEAKYWRTVMVGSGAIFIDQVGKDDGRNVSQANLTISNAQGNPIGAMTVGIDVDKLAAATRPVVASSPTGQVGAGVALGGPPAGQ